MDIEIESSSGKKRELNNSNMNQNRGLNGPAGTSNQSGNQNSIRTTSSRRLRHEAEVEVLKSKTGDLNEIRESLGLRPSQICEILKVHPSAWTRWVKSKKAPPHIYQMLEWYVELLTWRGQNSPLKSDILLPKKIRMESLESYVPLREPFEFTKSPNPLHNPHNFIEKRVFLTILSLSFLFQCGLSVFLYLWLKH